MYRESVRSCSNRPATMGKKGISRGQGAVNEGTPAFVMNCCQAGTYFTVLTWTQAAYAMSCGRENVVS